jgi:hypothetical protein
LFFIKPNHPLFFCDRNVSDKIYCSMLITLIRFNIRNCLPLTSTWVHPWLLMGSMLLIFLVLYVVLFVFILGLVFPILPVSVDCPFMIALSISSSVWVFFILKRIKENSILQYILSETLRSQKNRG